MTKVDSLIKTAKENSNIPLETLQAQLDELIGLENVKKQAKYIKEKLNITNIYSSDIKRAKQTAEIISSYLNLNIVEEIGLREINNGMVRILGTFY